MMDRYLVQRFASVGIGTQAAQAAQASKQAGRQAGRHMYVLLPITGH